MGYINKSTNNSKHKCNGIGVFYTRIETSHSELHARTNTSDSQLHTKSVTTKPKCLRRFSLPIPLADSYVSQYTIDPSDVFLDDDEYRQRSNSLPSTRRRSLTDTNSLEDQVMSDRKMLAIMANLIHIIIGIAMTQLGIVGTWYQHYMNFPKDQLHHILYICLMFIVLGVYGMCVIMKRLGQTKSHRIAYTVLSSLSIIASSFLIANSIRIIISDTYRTSQTVIMIFDALMLGLSGIEIPATVIGLYVTIGKPSSTLKQNLSENQPVEEEYRTVSKDSGQSWKCILSIILNVAHIVLGLCIAELGMVGMIYRNFMNIDNNGLFAVVFISLGFVSLGIMGIYNQLTGKAAISCNLSMYACASLLAVGCAVTIMSCVSVAMSNKQYYAGIEAIVAFDVMILSMSGMEIVVGIATTALCVIPVCIAKLTKADNKSISSAQTE